MQNSKFNDVTTQIDHHNNQENVFFGNNLRVHLPITMKEEKEAIGKAESTKIMAVINVKSNYHYQKRKNLLPPTQHISRIFAETEKNFLKENENEEGKNIEK